MSEPRLRSKSIVLGGGLETPGYEYVLLEDAFEEIREMQASFDLRWNADMRAIKRWQAAHPGSELIWPDHADMVVWMLERLDEAVGIIEAADRRAEAADGPVSHVRDEMTDAEWRRLYLVLLKGQADAAAD